MTRNLTNSICLASLLGLGLGLAGAPTQAADLGDKVKKSHPGLLPEPGDTAFGDMGPPVYLPGDDDAEPGLGNDSPRSRCAPDVDRSGRIDFHDMLEVLFEWGNCPVDRSPGNAGTGGSQNDLASDAPCPADIDGNRRVDLKDLLLVLANMDKNCGDRDISNFP